MAKTRRRTSEQRIADRTRRTEEHDAQALDWARKATAFWAKCRVGDLPRVE